MIEPEYMGKGVALPTLDECEGVDSWATGAAWWQRRLNLDLRVV